MTTKNQKKLELKSHRKPPMPMFKRTKSFAEKKENIYNKYKKSDILNRLEKD